MRAATARAYPNIALVKYWGKRDAAWNLPATGSLSLTLDVFPTTTTVEPDPTLTADVFTLDGVAAPAPALERVRRFLDLVRERAGTDTAARVRSVNTVPTGAGLASSASGFAALAVAASAAYDLDLERPGLSRLARRGSGSAARSLVDGMALWHAGTDEESFAEPVASPEVAMVVTVLEAGPKPVSSREAMTRTALTSPYYRAWVESASQSLQAALSACRDGDLDRLGRIAESNALRMHAAIEASDPPVRYLRPGSIAVFDRVEQLREEGLCAYATADAGPNVVVICPPSEAEAVRTALAPFGTTVTAGPGPGAALLAEPVG